MIHSTPEMDSLGYEYYMLRDDVIYDTDLRPSKHATASSVIVTTFIPLTSKSERGSWSHL